MNHARGKNASLLKNGQMSSGAHLTSYSLIIGVLSGGGDIAARMWKCPLTSIL